MLPLNHVVDFFPAYIEQCSLKQETDMNRHIGKIRMRALAFLAVFLGMATSLCSDTTHFALFAIAATSAVAVFFRLLQAWSRCFQEGKS